MKLTRQEALNMLEEGYKLNPGRWVQHSKKVGYAAGEIAAKLNLDVDKAITMGYIHDIGKRFGKDCQHGMKGYEYLVELGIDKEYANVCLTHSYLYNDINCTAGGYPNTKGYYYDFRKEFIKNHDYTIYDKIINICDLICITKITTLEKRLIDIYTRRGVHENTVTHINAVKKLRKEIEEKMGCTIYSLFPEIRDNL